MKLTHLDLTNFRSFRGTSVPLDAQRVLFAGLNNSGKSSVAEAITWVLTGCSNVTDARGAGAELLIPTGGKIAEAAVTIDGIGKVQRSYAEKGGGAFSVEGFTGTSQIQQNALFMKLNTTPEFLKAVLSTEAFLDLGHVEAKAMVLSLLGVKFTVPALLSLASPANGELEECLVGGWCSAHGTDQPHQPKDPSVYTLDELDMHYKQAFEDRKLAKKALANCVLPAKPTAAQMPTIQAIDAQLQKLRMDLGALQKVTGSVTGRRQALDAEMKRIDFHGHPLWSDDLSEQIVALKAKLAELETVVAPPIAQPGEAPQKGDPKRLQFLRTSVERLQQYEPSDTCVFGAGIPCKTPPKAFRDGLAAINKELKRLDPKPENVPQPVVESPLTTIRRQLTALEQEAAGRVQDVADAKKAEERTQQIRQEIDALPSTETQDAEIATLQERIGKGEQLLKDARNHWNAVDTYDDAVKRQQIQKADVDRLESLVEQLGPNGIRVQALAEAMGSFEAAVNPYVSAFGWTITFSVEPWTVLANGRPVETYSESERFRIGLSLQLGIAMLSGLKFAIVDRVDQLDAANRATVTKMLLSAPLDQILILGTREPSQALPQMQGIVAYRLVNNAGTSIIAERSAA